MAPKRNLSKIATQVSASSVAAETQIAEQQRITEYTIREYPVEVLVSKYLTGIDDDTSEIIIPDYQREFIWKKPQQSKFIESVLIGLPIPYLFAADSNIEGREGCLEIIDGSQRLRTLAVFLENKLKLTKINKLDKLNGYKFSDLQPARQRRFRRTTIRMIELNSKANEETKLDMFDRLNTGGTKLTFMENLRGSIQGSMMELIDECAKSELFRELCPVSASRSIRFEREELVLRFFAYTEKYTDFVHRVDEFLQKYVKSKTSANEAEITQLREVFNRMLTFVKSYFPYGFKRTPTDGSVPRIRYEAIAVGSALALSQNPEIIPADVTNWLNGEEFKYLTRSDASNNKNRVTARFEFVKRVLLGENIEILKKEYTLGQTNEDEQDEE